MYIQVDKQNYYQYYGKLDKNKINKDRIQNGI